MTLAHSTTEPEVCLWPLDPACLGDAWGTLEPDVQARAQMLASMTLFTLTGQRVGGCPVTVRPSLEAGRCYIGSGPIDPRDLAVAPYAYMAGARTDRGILLPPPVYSLVEVAVDGVALDLADFRVDDGRRLVWQGVGPSPLPVRQDLSQPAGAPGTFTVAYENTYPVSPAGAYAAGALAMEYAKACTGTKGCRLPSNVTTLVRQGVTMNFTEGVFPKGRTTIPEVDRFIGLWNPQGRRQDAQVWSPHLNYPTSTTWEG